MDTIYPPATLQELQKLVECVFDVKCEFETVEFQTRLTVKGDDYRVDMAIDWLKERYGFADQP